MISAWLGCLILAGVIFLICTPVFHYDETVGVILCTLLMCTCGLIIGCSYTSATHYVQYEDRTIGYEYGEKTYLYSLEDNLSIGGSMHISGGRNFVLGYGQIEETLYYYTLIKNGKGYEFYKINAESVMLIPDTEAYLISEYAVIEDIATTGRDNFIFGTVFKPVEKSVEKHTHMDCISEELHVPENCIKQSYNIDLR